MAKTIEEIFNILLDFDCSPVMVNKDNAGFSRTILFHTPYNDCWIEWWNNISYLSIGDMYGNKIPFHGMNVCTTRANCNLALDFTTDNTFEHTISVVLKKLDWQENKSNG